MKNAIHPQFKNISVTCVCGNTFEAGSTIKSIEVDICAACHPFFTNEMRFVDRKGRVDRFRKQVEHAQQQAPTGRAAKAAKQSSEELSFKDILQQQKASL